MCSRFDDASYHTDDLEGEPLMEAKIQSLLLLLARLSFHQAVVFCNSRPDAEYLAEQLVLPMPTHHQQN